MSRATCPAVLLVWNCQKPPALLSCHPNVECISHWRCWCFVSPSAQWSQQKSVGLYVVFMQPEKAYQLTSPFKNKNSEAHDAATWILLWDEKHKGSPSQTSARCENYVLQHVVCRLTCHAYLTTFCRNTAWLQCNLRKDASLVLTEYMGKYTIVYKV
jgi:hypothetical protein